MASVNRSTARLLLERIPENERPSIVRDVATSLTQDSDKADLGLAIALLQIQSDEHSREILVGLLQDRLNCGDISNVTELCSTSPILEAELFVRTIDRVSVAADQAGSESARLDADPVNKQGGSPPASVPGHHNSSQVNTASLRFLTTALGRLPDSDRIGVLFRSCLTLLGSKTKEVSLGAHDALFAILELDRPLDVSSQQTLWRRVQTLMASKDSFYQSLGSSLWLRWVIAGHNVDVSLLKDPKYWDLVEQGLLLGDSERRKSSLQVLRASVEIAVKEPSLISMVATSSRHEASPETIQKQYVRFCTVFETIVLGRYLNQVQECEPDLDFMSSKESVIKPVWLYTLLASSLAQKMQDSNRKFMGSWIMRSAIRTDGVDEFLKFFRAAFLPWVMGGHLFTSTLRKRGGVLRCEHGEKLSAYVSKLLDADPQLAAGVIDAILGSILARHGNNFAYAMVYLIEGIGNASNRGLQISPEHLENVGKIATWAGLPEVARDYILAGSWNMCHTYHEKYPSASTDSIANAGGLWLKLTEKLQSLPAGASAHIHGNIASLALEPSRRDTFERKSIQKCVDLVTMLESTEVSAIDPSKFEDAIYDVWSDLEYLEYPKSLLAVLPSLVPHPKLLQAALSDSSEDQVLARILATRTLELLELTQSRSYLLAPLAISVRGAALSSPRAVDLFKLEDFVMGLAEHPPVPTVDAELEDAVVPLLRSLGPETAALSYEYYFGPRESHGFAALLDLVARLQAVDADLPKRIFDRHMDRWMRQKIPPPSVSPWKNTLQLQILLLCSEQYLSRASPNEAKGAAKKLHFLLAVEPLPRYRYLFEWMIARVYSHHHELRPGIFEELRTKDHHSNPKFLASLMKLGVTIAKTDTSQEAFACDLANVFVPLAASSKVVIRHEAQWQIPVLMDHARAKSWASISENKAFVELDDFIRSLERYGDPPLERQIDKLDPIKDNNLSHLVEGPWHELDHVERRQTSRSDFLQLYASDDVPNLPDSCLPLGEPRASSSTPPQLEEPPNPDPSPANPDHQSRKLLQNIDNISRALGSGPVGPTSSLALQTKGAAYLHTTATSTRHANLLVLASLITNPYNLGGLSRCSEIFGAGALYISNPPLTLSSRDFTGVSVSSHLHFPILPLVADAMGPFLSEKKREEGFTVVGIEQTDRSVMIGAEDCVLPEKCILVLGSEREGIPATILSECDVLVEIPQVGITRSLNVQTAAAIVLCEYAKQHQKKEKKKVVGS